MLVVLVAFCPLLSLGHSLRLQLIKYLSSFSISVFLSMFIHSFIHFYIPHHVCKLDTCSRGGEKKRILFCALSTTSVFFYSCVCVTLSLAGSSSSSSSHCRQDGRVRSRQRRLFSLLLIVLVVDSLFPMRRALLLSIVGHHYIHTLIEND